MITPAESAEIIFGLNTGELERRIASHHFTGFDSSGMGNGANVDI